MSPELIAKCQQFVTNWAPKEPISLIEFRRELSALVLSAVGKPGAPASRPPDKTGAKRAQGQHPVCRFGRNKDMPLSGMELKDLQWYRGAIERNVADPDKARFLDDNVAHLAEIDAELEGR